MTIEAYIARDSDGRLFLHFNEPKIDNLGGMHWQSLPYRSMINLDNTPLDEIYKNLEFKDNPIKIKIKN